MDQEALFSRSSLQDSLVLFGITTNYLISRDLRVRSYISVSAYLSIPLSLSSPSGLFFVLCLSLSESSSDVGGNGSGSL